jgi:hypothetical protein
VAPCGNSVPGTAVVRTQKRREDMDKFTFGMTMLLIGMGGTILTLGLISIIICLLKKIFPVKHEVQKGA